VQRSIFPYHPALFIHLFTVAENNLFFTSTFCCFVVGTSRLQFRITPVLSCLPVGKMALHFCHYAPSLLVAIPVASVTPSHKSEINAVPTPGSKAVLAGDSRRRQALMTLLDVLGLTTDEVPLLLVRTSVFGVFHASALRTGAVGGQGHRTTSEDGREVCMYQDRCHGFLMPIIS